MEEFSVNLSPQYFQWEEFFNGRRLLREQGWLVGAGPLIYLNLLQSEPAGSLLLKGKAEVFGGVVGYTGETQPPNTFPIRTDVNYVGVKGEVDLGWRFTANKVSFEPFGGIGYRWWLRDLVASGEVDVVEGQEWEAPLYYLLLRRALGLGPWRLAVPVLGREPQRVATARARMPLRSRSLCSASTEARRPSTPHRSDRFAPRDPRCNRRC